MSLLFLGPLRQTADICIALKVPAGEPVDKNGGGVVEVEVQMQMQMQYQ